jgi:hypothetical protein
MIHFQLNTVSELSTLVCFCRRVLVLVTSFIRDGHMIGVVESRSYVKPTAVKSEPGANRVSLKSEYSNSADITSLVLVF